MPPAPPMTSGGEGTLLDSDLCYRALTARDARFDGRFFVGVLTTGIYCRPVCPARTPFRHNVRFYPTAAAAAAGGLRPCRRCRPDTLPGSREWDARSDLVARALRLISSGAADARGAQGIAASLHVSQRHLNRELVAQVGTTVTQLCATRRAQTARMLLECTALPMSEVAFAAGFGSVRQFNEVMRTQFAVTPSALRSNPPAVDRSTGSVSLCLRLAFRPPYARAAVLGWLARHAVPGVDQVSDVGVSTSMPDGTVIAVTWHPAFLSCAVTLPDGADIRVLPQRIAAVRRWLDLDANPALIDADLSRQPLLRPYVRRHPGMRVLGALDPFRALVSTVVSQQVSVPAAATQNARLAAFLTGGNRFPLPEELAAAIPDELAAVLGIPRARGATLVAVAEAVASGGVQLDGSVAPEQTLQALSVIKGIGPWTLADVRMRTLSDPDVWPAGDLILRRAIAPTGRFAGLDPASVAPWRSYLAHHAWVANADPAAGLSTTRAADETASQRPMTND